MLVCVMQSSSNIMVGRGPGEQELEQKEHLEPAMPLPEPCSQPRGLCVQTHLKLCDKFWRRHRAFSRDNNFDQQTENHFYGGFQKAAHLHEPLTEL